MDIATLIGLVGAFGLVFAAIFMGGNAAGFVDIPSIAIVVGGTFAVTFVMFPLGVVIGTIKVGLKTLMIKSNDPQNIIRLITSLADTARKQSLVSLEKVAIDDPFLKKGVMLVVDGSSETLVRSVMEIELDFMRQRHRQGQSVFKGMGTMAPAFGMIGTLIGLVNMLSNLSDPSSIGPAMAVALLTTFYGAVLANCVFLPMATKLEERSAEDALFMQIMIEGVASLQRGDHPTVVKEKLQAFLAPAMREQA
ncbi:MAG: MotA/TolQ/ExbB proton channel family protein [Pseudodesulfovibrio sp.]|uniref:MotA/TolQ/ExbB proton channel n=1 Tax=Pseudodesulfovibrio aespoeensis (strain ATCC 700646 / DSM 10631 / Aspo-2) TaxID=643562 RepID=E6VXX9_PSEA9|nr:MULTISPECIES: MotA/TolQ/ExbB proton channel family protein [Pseudodesulfovibrio]MBU4191923.1 MotA/TolQ/ExbB proton channel family protein [Pseudomonadota bacterium]ADU62686.1 MotA/TolQ/ExbB proton channel [Pseudodesulfovibrio aespoeensis Aspo-2]MBU4380012.1 MotA/TolQ/ExbB proton channel family protein [Pseudomonadota bacterium]MBU4474339.1 MotA/TolQ/ExbB proton channel family protein [Pseudomonadota bacterium]MBU4515623.1 MotA/TolQ/ExbB proton channel family protein [Pseudomonadota bacteriu